LFGHHPRLLPAREQVGFQHRDRLSARLALGLGDGGGQQAGVAKIDFDTWAEREYVPRFDQRPRGVDHAP
jgi:hypothetical protein